MPVSCTNPIELFRKPGFACKWWSLDLCKLVHVSDAGHVQRSGSSRFSTSSLDCRSLHQPACGTDCACINWPEPAAGCDADGGRRSKWVRTGTRSTAASAGRKQPGVPARLRALPGRGRHLLGVRTGSRGHTVLFSIEDVRGEIDRANCGVRAVHMSSCQLPGASRAPGNSSSAERSWQGDVLHRLKIVAAFSIRFPQRETRSSRHGGGQTPPAISNRLACGKCGNQAWPGSASVRGRQSACSPRTDPSKWRRRTPRLRAPAQAGTGKRTLRGAGSLGSRQARRCARGLAQRFRRRRSSKANCSGARKAPTPERSRSRRTGSTELADRSDLSASYGLPQVRSYFAS